jgi:hypothetical protein
MFVVGLSTLLVVNVCRAQQTHLTESQVESAYLYNFGKFVTWPSEKISASGSLEICLLGDDPFGTALDSIVAGEKIDGHPLAVKRIALLEEEDRCNILFISSSKKSSLRAILASAERSGILTVSDIPHFAERGGVIGFVLFHDRIRFEVNRHAAEESHLVLSSELLKVASKVIGKNTRGGGQ